MLSDQEDHQITQAESLLDISSSDEELEMAKKIKIPQDVELNIMTDSQLNNEEDADADDESDLVPRDEEVLRESKYYTDTMCKQIISSIDSVNEDEEYMCGWCNGTEEHLFLGCMGSHHMMVCDDCELIWRSVEGCPGYDDCVCADRSKVDKDPENRKVGDCGRRLLPLSLILLAYGAYRYRGGIISLAKSLFS
jgi:hypothetical protein